MKLEILKDVQVQVTETLDRSYSVMRDKIFEYLDTKYLPHIDLQILNMKIGIEKFQENLQEQYKQHLEEQQVQMKGILKEVISVHDKNMKERSNMQLLVKQMEQLDVVQKGVNAYV